MASGPPAPKPTPAQVTALGGSYLTESIYLGTIFDYLLNEGTGTATTADVSGNDLTLTLVATDEVDWTDTGLRFDGSPEYAIRSDATYNEVGDFSMEVWTKIDTFVATGGIVSMGGSVSVETEVTNSLFEILMTGASGAINLFYVHESGAGVNNILTFTTNLIENTVYHIVMVRDVTANTVDLYIDGAFHSQQTYTSGDPTIGAGTASLGLSVRIGSLTAQTNTMYRVHGYSRKLLSAEITTLFNTPFGVFASSVLTGAGSPSVGIRRRRRKSSIHR